MLCAVEMVSGENGATRSQTHSALHNIYGLKCRLKKAHAHTHTAPASAMPMANSSHSRSTSNSTNNNKNKGNIIDIIDNITHSLNI